MLLRKKARFWMTGLMIISFALILFVSGCSGKVQNISNNQNTETEIQGGYEGIPEKDEILDVSLEIYEGFSKKGKIENLETVCSIVNAFGEKGYPAVDSRNQIDMVNAEQVIEFHEMVESQKDAEITIIQVDYQNDFVRYDVFTQGGSVEVFRTYYAYENQTVRKEVCGKYQAEHWNYTEEGYLMFSGSWYSEELYILTLSGVEEDTALRVQPLDETCRMLTRKYLTPISFERNNMFIVDWNENDFGELNFYDMYDILYRIENGKYVPYGLDDNLGVGAVYQIPKDEFEGIIKTYFNIDSETLQSKTIYYSEDSTYEYKPRGFEEVEYPEYPFSEVVAFTENSDGTITLLANVVDPYAGDSKVYAHEVVVRPLEDGKVQYVSNRIVPAEDNCEQTWHVSRLTKEEWEELYGDE